MEDDGDVLASLEDDYLSADDELDRADQLEEVSLSEESLSGADRELETLSVDREHELHARLGESRTIQHSFAQHCLTLDAFIKELHLTLEEYRNRCITLEDALSRCPCGEETRNAEERQLDYQVPADFPTALQVLEDERKRCLELKKLNGILRQHVELTTEENAALTTNLNDLTKDLDRATRESLSASRSTHDEVSSRLSADGLARLSTLQDEVRSLKQNLREMRAAFQSDVATMRTALSDSSAALGIGTVSSPTSPLLPTGVTPGSPWEGAMRSIACSVAGAIENTEVCREFDEDVDTERKAALERLGRALPRLVEMANSGVGTMSGDLVSTAVADMILAFDHSCKYLGAQLEREQVNRDSVLEKSVSFQVNSRMLLNHSGLGTFPLLGWKTVEELNKQIEALNSENDRLQAALSDKQGALDDKSILVEDLQETQRRLAAACEKGEQENRRLKEERAKFETEVRVLMEKCETLKSDVEFIKTEKKHCMSSNALLRQKTTELEDSKQALEQELVVLRDALRNIEELNESHIRDKEEITIAVKALEDSKSNLERLQLESKRRHGELDDRCEALKQELADLSSSKKRLERLLKESEARETDLKTSLSQRTQEVASTTAEVAQLELDKGTLSLQVAGLEEALHAQQEAASKLRSEMELLAQAKSKAETALLAAKSDCDRLQQELGCCRRDKDALMSERQSTMEALATAAAERESLNNKLKYSLGQCSQLEGKIRELKAAEEAEADRSREQQDLLNRQLQELKSEYSAKLAEQRKLSHQEAEKQRREKAKFAEKLEELHKQEMNRQQELYQELEGRHQAELTILRQKEEETRLMWEAKSMQLKQHNAQLLQTLEEEKQELAEYLRRREEELSSLKERLEVQLEEATSKMADKQTKLSSAHAKVEQLEDLLSQARAEVLAVVSKAKIQEASMEKQVARLTEERDCLRSQLAASKSTLSSLQHDNAEIIREKHDLESKVLVLEKEMSVLRAEHSSGVSELEQLRRSTTNQQSEFRASTRERENLLQEASQKFRGAEMARAVLAEDCQLLRGHLQDSERIREVLERKVRDLKAELVEQGSQLESLQASSAQNTSRMEAAHRDVLQWKEKASAFERERETLYQERATLKQRLEECCQQLRAEQEARNKSLRESSRVSETLVGERASLEKRLLDLGREKHQVQLQLSTTQGKMAALETQLASVTESRKTMEDTLDALLSALRCTLGLQTRYQLRPASPAPQAPPSADSGAEEGSQEALWTQERSLLRRPTPDLESRLVLEAVDALRQRVASLQLEKERVKAEAEQRQREVVRLEAEIGNCKSQLARLTNINEKLTSENTQLRTQASKDLEVMADLKHAAQTQEWEKVLLSDQLSEATRKLQLKTEQCNNLQTALSRERPAELTSSTVRTSESLESRLSQLQVDKEFSQARLERLTLRIAQCQTESQMLQQAKREATSRVAQMERKAERLEQDKERLTAELSENVAKVKTLSDRLVDEVTRAMSLEEQKGSLEKQLRVLRGELDTLRANRSKDKSQLNELRSLNQALETKLSGLTLELAERDSAKERLGATPSKHQWRTNDAAESWRKLAETFREEKQHLIEEVQHLRRQLSRTVDGMATQTTAESMSFAFSHRSLGNSTTLAERDVPDGESGARSPEIARIRKLKRDLENRVRVLEGQRSRVDQRQQRDLTKEHRRLTAEIASLRTTLGSRRTSTPLQHQDGEVPEFGDDLSGVQGLREVLNNSLLVVAEHPERLHDETLRLNSAITEALLPGDQLMTPSKLTSGTGQST